MAKVALIISVIPLYFILDFALDRPWQDFLINLFWGLFLGGIYIYDTIATTIS